ncbi:Gfo/Idh/MocA family oxidoreductase [Streptomyces sp. S07_1.15]|uniref:Gfo/Idh/MocA family oxidoreductase n=1 Tax=Streptomyces sp. S07_1.15 TaxID=2873925 RepID=UPI001D13B74C|nr:Gfo/Idh/MocA family oxidoreductase [Streptomyces sp. S07_1.15]MCC3655291.1 Gfo/Idh/MocA family oxidoreductase [Streptomyces sp. S07_1.15]
MDVVIVGAGKAGSLHYRAYSRLGRSGVLDRTRIRFVDPRERAGAELAALLRADGLPENVVAAREKLEPAAPETTIVDLCLPSRTLAPALVDWWRAGYRNFVIEKPFMVPQELAREVGQVLASSRAVLVRNYLHSRVHATVRELLDLYDLEPVLCVTNFSKDRRADNLRGRGASADGLPTVYEVEMPHQLYIGDDLLGAARSLDHAEDLDPMAGEDGRLRLGEGLLVGRAASGAAFVHYSNLHHPTVVRSLDLFCRGRLSVHATYAPICEEFTDIKAGVILGRGDAVLAKQLFTEDDNMHGMISSAYHTLRGGTGGRLGLDEVLRSDGLIRSAIAGGPGSGPGAAAPAVSAPRTDLLQEWVVDSFRSGLENGTGRSFLRFLEGRQRTRLSGVLPSLDPARDAVPGRGTPGHAVRGALV